MFVMSIHLSDSTIFSWPYINSFRMPFYFFICGLFLKTTDSFSSFLRKKINVLIIPFIFFELLGIIFYAIGHLINGSMYSNCWSNFLSPFVCVNGPIWFLLCLFSAYMIYFVLANTKLGKNTWRLTLSTVFISFLSFYASKMTIMEHRFVLPFFISTALTSIVFIHSGSILKQKMGILEKNKYDLLCLLGSLMIFGLISFWGGPCDNNFLWNSYQQSYTQTIFAGIFGSLSILYICKFLVKVPVISYIGRYSIIALGTHVLFLDLLWTLEINPYIQLLILLVLVCTCIFILKKYFPKFCAQEPFFTTNKCYQILKK